MYVPCLSPCIFLIRIVPGRNPDWIDLNIRHSLDIVKGGLIAGFFPAFLRPYVAPLDCSRHRFRQQVDRLVIRFLTNIPRSVARGVRLLDPIIEERRKRLNEDEKNWGDKPVR